VSRFNGNNAGARQRPRDASDVDEILPFKRQSLAVDPLLVSALRSSTFSLVEARAAREGAPFRCETASADEGGDAFACSFERRVLGLGSKHHHGAIVSVGATNVSELAELACGHLSRAGSFDQATFRVSLPAYGDSALAEELSYGQFEVGLQAIALQEILLLPDSMTAFEQGLGRNARRNIRKSRTRAGAARLRFAIGERAQSVDRLAVQSLTRNSMPRVAGVAEFEAISRFQPMRGSMFQVTLYSPGDDLVAVAGGVCEGEVATVLYQLNDRRYRANSPSLLLRSFLVEEMIERKMKSIVFSGACMGTLRPYCKPITGGELFIQRSGIFPQLKRSAQVVRLFAERLVPRDH
jgi:hypothetical protein